MTTMESTAVAPTTRDPAAARATGTDRIRIEQHGSAGLLWLAGWLFSIGFLQLPFLWKGVLALIAWPYYLGSALTKLLP